MVALWKQQKAKRPKEIDWNGWADWLESETGTEDPWMFLSNMGDQIKDALQIEREAADKLLDGCLRKARKIWPAAGSIVSEERARPAPRIKLARPIFSA